MALDSKIIFVLGKGGVGKTTVSTLIGLFFANTRAVNIYSFDQAHNLGDVLRVKLNDKPILVKPRLNAAEVNIEKWKRKYLAQMKTNLKSAYSYLSAYNMLDFFDVMEEAPDIDQLSLLLAFDDIVRSARAEVIIIDMPPTALAVEFFKVVRRNIRWIDALIALREKIMEKKEIISKIRFGNKEIETDKVLKKLYELKGFYSDIQCILNRAVLLVVQNPDTFSRLEAQRIIRALKDLGYENLVLIDNKERSSYSGLFLPVLETDDLMRDFDKILIQSIDFFLGVEKIVYG